MKLRKGILLSVMTLGMLSSTQQAFAGNEDRAGSAGATELLINPWTRSSAWGDAGVASVKGLEAMFTNVAGLAYTNKTEIAFARTNWLGNMADIGLNSFGLAQKVGESGVLGVSIMNMNFGDIQTTTTELPEGGIGTFKPSFTNITLGYAKQFSSSISGGLNLKVVSEVITNVKAQGVALDAGIRYVTGENDNIKFAISLKNVGPPMKYSGDGLSLEMMNTSTSLLITNDQRVAAFELPSQLHIGAAYDFLLSEKHTLSTALAFSSNSFTKDQIRVGAEYQMDGGKAFFLLRAGYVYEKGLLSSDDRSSSLTGPTAGLSVDFPMGENKNLIGLDYAFRTSNLGAVHTVGVRLDLK